MEDRVTVKLGAATESSQLSALADEVADALGLSRHEAEALLSADTLVLDQQEARILAGLCRKLGLEVAFSAPSTRRKAGAPRLALAAAAVLVLCLTLALVWPSPSAEVSETVARPSADSAPSLIEPIPPGSRDFAEPRDAQPRTADLRGEESRAAQADPPEIEPVPPTLPSQEPSPPNLFAAARDGSPSEVRRALEATPQADVRDEYGQTPLMYAAGANSAEAVTLLLAAGAAPDARSDAGWTPLMYAARNALYPEAALRLLEAGADFAARNDSGQTARDIALAYNNTRVAVHLLGMADPAIPSPGSSGSSQAASPIPSVTVFRPEAPQPPASPAFSDAEDEASREALERCLQDWNACGTD